MTFCFGLFFEKEKPSKKIELEVNSSSIFVLLKNIPLRRGYFLIKLYMLMLLLTADDVFDDEVNNGEGKDADYKTNEAVEDGVFGFFDFASIARRSHVINTADNHHYYADEAEYTNDGIDDTRNAVGKIFVPTSYCCDTGCSFIGVRSNLGVCSEFNK